MSARFRNCLLAFVIPLLIVAGGAPSALAGQATPGSGESDDDQIINEPDDRVPPYLQPGFLGMSASCDGVVTLSFDPATVGGEQFYDVTRVTATGSPGAIALGGQSQGLTFGQGTATFTLGAGAWDDYDSVRVTGLLRDQVLATQDLDCGASQPAPESPSTLVAQLIAILIAILSGL